MRSYTIFLLLIISPLFLRAQQKDSSSLTVKEIKEVFISARKPFIEQKADKVVLNVQSGIVTAGASAFELLQKAPGVSITNDEVINMAGKAGVNVLIDGRPTQMSTKDLAVFLRSTPASAIDKVEIISNPSSRYDAQGNAGIINIRMKKIILKGTNGSITSSYVQGVHSNGNLSSSINHRSGSFNFFANATARKWRQNTSGYITRFVNADNVARVFENTTVDQDASENAGFRAGVDWFKNKKNSFGVLIQGNEYSSSLSTPGITLIKSSAIVDSSLRTMNNNHQRNSRYAFNFNYRYEDTTGTRLDVDANYVSYRNLSSGLVTTDLVDRQNIQYGYTANDQRVSTAINISGLRADYARQYKKSHVSLEAGVKWNSIKTVNDMNASVWAIDHFSSDTGRSNRFRYTENNYAAYFSFNKKIRSWELQAGLRSELSVIKGRSTDLKGNTISFPDTSYLNLFPTVFVRYAINEQNNVGLSYGRRINRPTYQDLNPFEHIYDNYTRERGNPYLMPELSDNIELSYSYRGMLNIGLGYSRTKNAFNKVSVQKGNITDALYLNIGNEYRYYGSISAGMPVTGYWYSYTQLSPFYKQFKGELPEGKLDRSAFGMSWYSSHQFTLPDKWKIELSSWGSLAGRDGMYFNGWLGSVDMGLAKQIMKDKINLRISVTDIFNTQRWKQSADFGNVNFVYNRKWESRTISFQVTWNFGKSGFRSRNRELGSQNEIDRIK